jgi:hypothetical protein
LTLPSLIFQQPLVFFARYGYQVVGVWYEQAGIVCSPKRRRDFAHAGHQHHELILPRFVSASVSKHVLERIQIWQRSTSRRGASSRISFGHPFSPVGAGQQDGKGTL